MDMDQFGFQRSSKCVALPNAHTNRFKNTLTIEIVHLQLRNMLYIFSHLVISTYIFPPLVTKYGVLFIYCIVQVTALNPTTGEYERML